MTDRVNGFTVILKKDMRDDDCEALKDAIRLLKGVVTVKHTVSNGCCWNAQIQTHSHFTKKLFVFVNDPSNWRWVGGLK